jgi:3-methyl-2-oxobutanoate hydroxymethyltransferase
VERTPIGGVAVNQAASVIVNLHREQARSYKGHTMSHHDHPTRITVPDIVRRKGQEKIVCLTAYSAPVAALLDAQVDILLVGDSLGMVVHGLPSTVAVTLEMMILHGQAVMRGSRRALVVVDLPFGRYEGGVSPAYEAAVQVMQQTGCQAVKVEWCDGMARTIAFLVQRGIPVMAHIGLLPQAVNVAGGFKTRGHTLEERQLMLRQAREAADAGAFAIVIEGVVEEAAREITESVAIPTIGIGASRACDGQILVVDDMLGMFEWTPRFVRRYGQQRELIQAAVVAYASDVRSGAFPVAAELYNIRNKS